MSLVSPIERTRAMIVACPITTIAYERDSYERIFRETGMPNPMRHGEPGASAAAYPNGMLSERIARWVVRKARQALRRAA